MSQVITCQDCGNPWGVILDRNEERSPKHAAQLLASLRAEHGDPAAPTPANYVQVIYLTQASGDFASEYLNTEMLPELPAWINPTDTDLPAWFIKQRKTRTALRWDCCNLKFNTI